MIDEFFAVDLICQPERTVNLLWAWREAWGQSQDLDHVFRQNTIIMIRVYH